MKPESAASRQMVRFSLDSSNSQEEIHAVIAAVQRCVRALLRLDGAADSLVYICWKASKGNLLMPTTVIATVVKMMESLPDSEQERVAEHLRQYIEDLGEELQWDTTFKKTQSQLVAAARRAKQEIAAGQTKPLDYDEL